ncbi:hypothetical protein JCM8547_002677 [Rhodosporidiobolus lusitaniae]
MDALKDGIEQLSLSRRKRRRNRNLPILFETGSFEGDRSLHLSLNVVYSPHLGQLVKRIRTFHDHYEDHPYHFSKLRALGERCPNIFEMWCQVSSSPAFASKTSRPFQLLTLKELSLDCCCTHPFALRPDDQRNHPSLFHSFVLPQLKAVHYLNGGSPNLRHFLSPRVFDGLEAVSYAPVAAEP